MSRQVALSLTLVLLFACGPEGERPQVDSSTPTEQSFPDVVDASASNEPGGTYAFAVTISSPYDSPTRYADAWRVKGTDGTVYGVRELLHDHAAEQPFTRTLTGVTIPEGVASVVIEGRDLVNGWGGKTATVQLPGSG